MILNKIGWDSDYQDQFNQLTNDIENEVIPGRVCVEHKSFYKVLTEYGELLAEISGKLRYEAEEREGFPAVGDWVVLAPRLENNRAIIKGILPRKSKFSRKVAGKKVEEQIVATNIDTVFIVSSLNNDFNVRRLERYLTQVWDCGANPVIILNKADLCQEITEKIAEVEAIAFGVPIHVISCLTRSGIEELSEYISDGITIALMGSSGVGKSTLINMLLGEERQQTKDIRNDDKGKHTTTYRELIVLPQGGIIIDTPGMRELQLWNDGSGVSETFEDVERLAAQCKFNDCEHDTEPGCAVKKAIKEGTLSEDRLKSYRKMLRELFYLEMKQKNSRINIDRIKCNKIKME